MLGFHVSSKKNYQMLGPKPALHHSSEETSQHTPETANTTIDIFVQATKTTTPHSTQTFPHLLFHHHTCFVLLFLDDLRSQFQTHLISCVWFVVCEHHEGRIYPPQESWDLKTGALEIPAIESQTLPFWRVQSLILREHKIPRVYTPHPPTGKPFLDVPLEGWIKGYDKSVITLTHPIHK